MTRRRILALGLVALVLVASGSAYGLYTYYNQESEGEACPSIFANVSFQNATGFVTITHPSSGETQFTLAPNSSGRIDAAFSSATNNLTTFQFASDVPAWEVTSSGISARPSQDVSVVPSDISANGIHTVVVHYIITSDSIRSSYLLGFPSTCRSVYLAVSG